MYNEIIYKIDYFKIYPNFFFFKKKAKAVPNKY